MKWCLREAILLRMFTSLFWIRLFSISLKSSFMRRRNSIMYFRSVRWTTFVPMSRSNCALTRGKLKLQQNTMQHTIFIIIIICFSEIEIEIQWIDMKNKCQLFVFFCGFFLMMRQPRAYDANVKPKTNDLIANWIWKNPLWRHGNFDFLRSNQTTKTMNV